MAATKTKAGAVREERREWYAAREELHLGRAAFQAPILAQCGVALAMWAAEGKLAQVEHIQTVLRTVLSTEYDTFAAQGRDLAEICGGSDTLAGKLLRLHVPGLADFLSWLHDADARLGTYPGGC